MQTDDEADKEAESEGRQTQPPMQSAQETIRAYGIGAKMLMRMGYRVGQGLGKNREGLVAPVDVRMRPRGLGLAYGGFEERAGTDDAGGAAAGAAAGRQGGGARQAGGGRARRKADPLKTPVAPPALAQTPARIEIIDMTGSGSGPQRGDAGDADGQLVELRHNVTLLADLAQASVDASAHADAADASRFAAVSRQLATLRPRLAEQQAAAAQLARALAACQRIAMVVETTEPSTLGKNVCIALEDTLSAALAAAVAENDALCVSSSILRYKLPEDLEAALVADAAMPLIPRWSPLAEPEFLVGQLWPAHARLGQSRYWHRFVGGAVFARLRQAIANDWDAREPGELLKVLGLWHPPLVTSGNTPAVTHLFSDPTVESVPADIHDAYPMRRTTAVALLAEAVLPKIVRAVRAWSPRREPSGAEAWIVPWLSVFSRIDRTLQTSDESEEDSGSDSEASSDAVPFAETPRQTTFLESTLVETLKSQLVDALGKWSPATAQVGDDWGLLLVQRWRPALGDEAVAQLVAQRIVPSLRQGMRQGAGAALARVGEWVRVGAIPVDSAAALVATAAAPQWHAQLASDLGARDWRRARDLVALWLAPERLGMPAQVWRSPAVEAELRRGLAMVEQCCETGAVVIPAPLADNSASSRGDARPREPAERVTFRELFANALQDAGLLLRPLGRTNTAGRPLYTVASGAAAPLCTLFLDGDVVFVQRAPTGPFEPMSVSGVIQACGVLV